MKKRLHFNSLKFQIILLLIIVILGIILAGGYSFLAVIHSNQVKYNEWCSQEIAAFENSYTQKYYKIQSIMSACGYNENMQRLLSGAEESSYEVLTPIDNMERSLILMMYNYTELDDALWMYTYKIEAITYILIQFIITKKNYFILWKKAAKAVRNVCQMFWISEISAALQLLSRSGNLRIMGWNSLSRMKKLSVPVYSQ